MIDWIANKFKKTIKHDKPTDRPGGVRKAFYQELLSLSEEERRFQALFDLSYPPRLTVVDETNRVMLRPQDRDEAGLDAKMREAFEERKEQQSQQQ